MTARHNRSRRPDRAGYTDQPMDAVVALLHEVAADSDEWLNVCWQRKAAR